MSKPKEDRNKRWQKISELKAWHGYRESELRRIAHSDEAGRYVRRTSKRGTFLFDFHALERDKAYLEKIGGYYGDF